jgi:hypothetical protein
LLFLLLLSSAAYAQIRSATITGVVHDATGAVVPGATVTITDQATGISNTTSTTSTGQYTFPYLSASSYIVEVKVSGFASYRETGVKLSTAETARVDVNLKVAEVGTTVEVAAQTAQVQTESTTVQSAIQSEMIDVRQTPPPTRCTTHFSNRA